MMTRKQILIVRDFDDTLMARIKLEARAQRIAVNQFWIQVQEATLTPSRKSLKPLGRKHRIGSVRSAGGQGSPTP